MHSGVAFFFSEAQNALHFGGTTSQERVSQNSSSPGYTPFNILTLSGKKGKMKSLFAGFELYRLPHPVYSLVIEGHLFTFFPFS